MRKLYNDCKIDGVSMLAPDQDASLSMSDLDAEGSGRDELGFMHRIVLREMVRKWKFQYNRLTEEEFAYISALFAGKAEFSFEYKHGNETVSTRAYCSGIEALLHNSRTGTYKGVSFSIIEC